MKKISIVNNGPYFVCGEVPLDEVIIEQTEQGNVYRKEKTFPLKSNYLLCRCGKTKNPPYCDGSHTFHKFDGKLSASREPFEKQASVIEGKNLILQDVENLCAFARFCHSKSGDVWSLTEDSNSQESERIAVKMTCDCPSGRLVMKEKKTKETIEPAFEQSISVLQDPERNCSGPLWVKGGISIEDTDGKAYEVRNRVTLCRCGKSANKPFCDSTHVNIGYKDSLKGERE